MTNSTIQRFGYPDTLIHEWEQWLLLLRPSQPTLGSCILAAKSDATAFGALAPAAHAELSTITAELESALRDFANFEKINYLMLMMVDPHVHFHVLPRYEGTREYNGQSFVDAGWPAAPDLKAAVSLSHEESREMTQHLRARYFPE